MGQVGAQQERTWLRSWAYHIAGCDGSLASHALVGSSTPMKDEKCWRVATSTTTAVDAAACDQVMGKVMATPFMQYLRPVGCGPSSNTWPRWPPHRLQRTSVRVMVKLVSGRSKTALSRAFQKLGKPVPLSNLVSDEERGCPQPAQLKTP